MPMPSFWYAIAVAIHAHAHAVVLVCHIAVSIAAVGVAAVRVAAVPIAAVGVAAIPIAAMVGLPGRRHAAMIEWLLGWPLRRTICAERAHRDLTPSRRRLALEYERCLCAHTLVQRPLGGELGYHPGIVRLAGINESVGLQDQELRLGRHYLSVSRGNCGVRNTLLTRPGRQRVVGQQTEGL